MLHKTKGNMYGWITHRWNPIRGKCPHRCTYCYMTKWKEPPPIRFVDNELKTDLESGHTIFVVSGCDLFAEAILDEWIARSLAHCSHYDNQYLLQSKNPTRIIDYIDHLPKKLIIGTTIETNRLYPEMGETPAPADRAVAMGELKIFDLKTMVTIEPIMEFDLVDLVEIVEACAPDFVNIGANTHPKVKLIEPNFHKVNALIDELQRITEVKIKPNLKRLQ